MSCRPRRSTTSKELLVSSYDSSQQPPAAAPDKLNISERLPCIHGSCLFVPSIGSVLVIPLFCRGHRHVSLAMTLPTQLTLRFFAKVDAEDVCVVATSLRGSSSSSAEDNVLMPAALPTYFPMIPPAICVPALRPMFGSCLYHRLGCFALQQPYERLRTLRSRFPVNYMI